jgi:hypothetical protein
MFAKGSVAQQPGQATPHRRRREFEAVVADTADEVGDGHCV